MKRKARLEIAAIALLALGAIPAARAAAVSTNNLGTLSGNVTLTGTLTDEAQVVEETFTLVSPGSLTAYTTSYGGGTNFDGTMTGAGGFQSMLTLYDAAGNYLMGEAVTSPVAHTDPKTGLAGDAYLTASGLMAGHYILVLTDWQNQQPATATNLSDGFNGPGGTSFLDVMGNARTGNFALNLSASGSVSATPEPATFWLILPVLACAALSSKRILLEKK